MALSPAQLTSTNGALRAGREIVDHPRDPSLPGSALAGQQHRGALALRQQRHLMGEVLHLRAGAERVEPVAGGAVAEERLVHPTEPHLVGDARGRGGEVRHVHGLGQEVLGAELHGAHCGGDVAVAGEENDGGIPVAQMLQHLHPVHAGKPKIEDDDVGTEPVVRGQPRLPAQLAGNLVAQALEVVADAPQDIDIVVDQKYRIRHDPRVVQARIPRYCGL